MLASAAPIPPGARATGSVSQVDSSSLPSIPSTQHEEVLNTRTGPQELSKNVLKLFGQSFEVQTFEKPLIGHKRLRSDDSSILTLPHTPVDSERTPQMRGNKRAALRLFGTDIDSPVKLFGQDLTQPPTSSANFRSASQASSSSGDKTLDNTRIDPPVPPTATTPILIEPPVVLQQSTLDTLRTLAAAADDEAGKVEGRLPSQSSLPSRALDLQHALSSSWGKKSLRTGERLPRGPDSLAALGLEHETASQRKMAKKKDSAVAANTEVNAKSRNSRSIHHTVSFKPKAVVKSKKSARVSSASEQTASSLLATSSGKKSAEVQYAPDSAKLAQASGETPLAGEPKHISQYDLRHPEGVAQFMLDYKLQYPTHHPEYKKERTRQYQRTEGFRSSQNLRRLNQSRSEKNLPPLSSLPAKQPSIYPVGYWWKSNLTRINKVRIKRGVEPLSHSALPPLSSSVTLSRPLSFQPESTVSVNPSGGSGRSKAQAPVSEAATPFSAAPLLGSKLRFTLKPKRATGDSKAASPSLAKI